MEVVRAMHDVYNISYPLGIFLATVGMLVCGSWWSLPWKFDLHDLAKHNKIEHDCSFVHEDAAHNSAFAPCRPDSILLKKLMRVPNGDHFSIEDFVRARIQRCLEVRKPLDAIHREIAHGETSLTMCVFGTTSEKCALDGTCNSVYASVVPRAFVQQWYGQDRLPIGWYKPDHQVGFLEVVRVSKLFAKVVLLNQYYITQSA